MWVVKVNCLCKTCSNRPLENLATELACSLCCPLLRHRANLSIQSASLKEESSCIKLFIPWEETVARLYEQKIGCTPQKLILIIMSWKLTCDSHLVGSISWESAGPLSQPQGQRGRVRFCVVKAEAQGSSRGNESALQDGDVQPRRYSAFWSPLLYCS